MSGGAELYAALIVLTLAACWWFGVDHDRGGYAEPFAVASFRTQATVEHFLASLVLTFAAGLVLGLAGGMAAGLTFLAGLGWELLQRFPRDKGAGYLSRVDLAADAAGCLIGWGLLALLGRA